MGQEYLLFTTARAASGSRPRSASARVRFRIHGRGGAETAVNAFGNVRLFDRMAAPPAAAPFTTPTSRTASAGWSAAEARAMIGHSFAVPSRGSARLGALGGAPRVRGGPPSSTAAAAFPCVAGGRSRHPLQPRPGRPRSPSTNAAAVAAVRSAFLGLGRRAERHGRLTSTPDRCPSTSRRQRTTSRTCFRARPDGLSAVVFDDTGEIFDEIFGPDSGVLGWRVPNGSQPTPFPDTFGTNEGERRALQRTGVRERRRGQGRHGPRVRATTPGSRTPSSTARTSGSATRPAPRRSRSATPVRPTSETMYPFYFGPGSGTQTLEKDDPSRSSPLLSRARVLRRDGDDLGNDPRSERHHPADRIDPWWRATWPTPYATPCRRSPATGRSTAAPRTRARRAYALHGLTPARSMPSTSTASRAAGSAPRPFTVPGPEEFFNGPDESVDPGSTTRRSSRR
jgi:hypothetical protein